MYPSNEEQRLSAVKALLGTELYLTDLQMIYPAGNFAAYALDPNGHVAGFKFGDSASHSQELLNLILGFSHLQRLVFFFSDATVDIPASIGDLAVLQYAYFYGNIRRLPKEILRLSLPITVQGFSAELKDKTEDTLAEIQSLLTHHKNAWTEKNDKKDTDVNDYELEVAQGLTLEEKRELESLWSRVSVILIEHAKLEDPPIEIVARGRDAIESYFRGKGAGFLQLNEVKVLLVGHGSSGKTSLVKQVLGEKFDASESQTHGINIRSLTFGKKKTGGIKANFWDFGGQEIMHATHQFFLSKRSLYVLVLDGRKEEDSEYWLQHIQSFGGESPVMIVLNKIDEHPAFDLNRRFLMNKYPGIIGFYRVSCATGLGISELKTALHEQLASAAILQTSWPLSWFKVKRRLEHLKSDYISVSEYNKVCAEENVSDQASQEALVEFLNDLGIVLHFKDLQLLDTHVLDPRWVTEGVYRIINSELLARQRGYLGIAQLSEVFRISQASSEFRYSPDKYSYIVELMLKFELCYRLGPDAILLPDLLNIQEPELDIDLENSLRFVFNYQYLPKSVMPRFIVRMHKDIRSNRSWRTGVELEDKALNATAIVRADEKAKRIYIFVMGDQKRDYFATIRKAVSDINLSFEKLQVTELVPLPDAADILIEYSDLIGHEVSGRDEIFVGKVGKGYSVSFLLNGIEDRTTRQHTVQTTFNVHGNYIAQTSVGAGATSVIRDVSKEVTQGAPMKYHAQPWEKVVSYLTAFLFIGTVVFLLIRNQPIADPNLVVALRILLSLMVAVFGASVPGMLSVDLESKKGIAIRSTGALALFVISFIMTPKVLMYH